MNEKPWRHEIYIEIGMLPVENPLMDHSNFVIQPHYDTTFGSNMISRDTNSNWFTEAVSSTVVPIVGPW